jgi:GT2 family glycosyltransferase
MLDEAFSPVQYEDLDYCYRARKGGYSVRTVPEARVYHFEHTTTAGSDDINFRYVTTRNGLLFKARWGQMFQAEHGTTDAAAIWKSLPKQSIAQVDWRALLPSQESAAGKETA